MTSVGSYCSTKLLLYWYYTVVEECLFPTYFLLLATAMKSGGYFVTDGYMLSFTCDQSRTHK